MTDHPTGGPAFPTNEMDWQDGMTLRTYAAIQLRVPDSGIDWLDDMIRQAKRDEIAGQALAGISSISGDGFSLPSEDEATWSYQRADAMLAEREKGGGE